MSPASHNEGAEGQLGAVRERLEHVVDLSLRWRPLPRQVWEDAGNALAEGVLDAARRFRGESGRAKLSDLLAGGLGLLKSRKGFFSRVLRANHERAFAWCLHMAGHVVFRDCPDHRLCHPMFETALAFCPELGWALYYSAMLRLMDGDVDAAIELADRSWWSHYPHPAAPVLSWILRRWSREGEGVTDSRPSSQADPVEKASFVTLYRLACDLDRIEETDVARVAFALAADKPIEKLTNAERAMHAWSQARARRFAEALAEYDALLADEPAADDRIYRAWVLSESGREEKAISELQAIAARDAEHAARCHFLIGVSQYDRGKHESAIGALRIAREAGWSKPACDVYLACARIRTGELSPVLDLLRDSPPDEQDDPDRLLIEAATLGLQGSEGWLAPLSRLPAERVGSGRSYGTVVWAARETSQLDELERWCGEGDDVHHRYLQYAIGVSYRDDQRWADAARAFDPTRATGDTGLAIVLGAASARLRCGEAAAARGLLQRTLPTPDLEPDWLLLNAAALAVAGDEHWMDPLFRLPPKQEAYEESIKTLVWAAQRTSRIEALCAWCESGDDVHRQYMVRFIAEADSDCHRAPPP